MRAAVVTSKGMGDGLMMMVASYHLMLAGYTVTTFQDILSELQDWFPGQHFDRRSTIEHLDDYDLVLLQNDNTPFSYDLIKRYRKKIHVFYASYEKEKHHPLSSQDYLFDRSRPLVVNIAEKTAALLGTSIVLKENGILPPDHLSYQKYKKRILIHPTSSTPKRTWQREKFIQVGQKLVQEGYEVAYCLSPDEQKDWTELHSPSFPTLSALAAYIYESHLLIGNESGTGHLASNLGIPTLIVAGCPKQMALWRPGFRLGEVITPPKYIPNFKGLRLREKNWQTFIQPHHILKAFHRMERHA